jgi:hypothetical protein
MWEDRLEGPEGGAGQFCLALLTLMQQEVLGLEKDRNVSEIRGC